MGCLFYCLQVGISVCSFFSFLKIDSLDGALAAYQAEEIYELGLKSSRWFNKVLMKIALCKHPVEAP